MAATAPQLSPECPDTPTVNNNLDNTNNNNNNVVLLNVFTIRKKSHRVFYNAGILVWERNESKKGRTTVPINDILAINPPANSQQHEQQTQHHSQQEQTNQQLQHEQLQSPQHLSSEQNLKCFTIIYARRSESSSNLNKWRYNSITLYSNNADVIQLWMQTLQHAINELTGRPKRLLIFVNPFGGKKRALQTYDHRVKPIFQLAGIDPNVVISQRSNQIRDFIMNQSLEHFDGIICIGGDGTFSEVFNGLIFRSIKDLGLGDSEITGSVPKITMPVGIIPAGSTDTVAYCLNGTTDICTAVLNIALGQINGLDLSSVSNSNGIVKFYASVMSYGFLGDVAIDSEKFRWLGPKRYDYSGFKKLLLNRGYEGEISMLLAPDNDDPAKGPACLENCLKCLSFKKTDSKSKDDTTKSVILNSKEYDGDRNGGHGDSSFINNPVHTPKVINGKFFMVNGANISCACARSPNGFSKYSHLCDGYIDLILVRHTSFFNNLRFLLTMSSQSNPISNLPHVEVYRTKEFTFRPNGVQQGISTYNLHSSRIPISRENSQTSVWNCDGEVIHDSEITVRSHRHLINVYRRGIYNNTQDNDSDSSSYGLCGFCM